ncbi:MAG: FxLYD domain-containing protein [Nanoarchaeota archaeon]
MRKESWFHKHPYLTTIIIVFILAFIYSVFSPSKYTDYEYDKRTVTSFANVNSDFENVGEIPLKIMDLSCEYGEYNWIYVKGRVKNEGSEIADFVKINIDLYDGDKWIESDFTYIRNTDLPAGATDSFEKTWTDDSIKFTKCEAFVTYSNF